jgi:hypothetical protein
LIAIPGKAGRVLDQVERGSLSVHTPQLSRQVTSVERAVDRLTAGIVFAACLLGGVLFYNSGNGTPAYVLFVGSAISLLWMIFLTQGRHPRR